MSNNSSFKTSLLFYFHLATFVAISIGIIQFYVFYVDQKINGGNPLGMLTFLTFWGQCRDLVFRSTAFPVGIIISSMFWGIYHFDQELILPRQFEMLMPAYLNHLQHTLPGVAMVLEMALVNHQYHRFLVPVIAGVASTANIYQDITQLLSFLMSYLAILVIARYIQGVWVYPIIEVIPTHSKVIFIFSSSCFFTAIYIISRQISRWIWGGETEFIAPKGVIKSFTNNNNNNNNISKKVN
ncbi:hypothetical protein PPL_10881 [Heterostelium album PN500]|uniref:Uncharacterized protein n=1 Tax=Heterostelium pallidum (strain ATCC 26659 / Pp 5 / PN500) TaxID=670386 RepID=D3BS89_HETP5|nr:hypothetical protein PPL_10881 [Heterostelium album PN500]EFA75826.1 hypothetical protein PPL_10881 [Heterostelium album PN500]|eukprot:XP_020427960.1 hypothetical protein PPL_10881 [Heterostelium album PN500]